MHEILEKTITRFGCFCKDVRGYYCYKSETHNVTMLDATMDAFEQISKIPHPRPRILFCHLGTEVLVLGTDIPLTLSKRWCKENQKKFRGHP